MMLTFDEAKRSLLSHKHCKGHHVLRAWELPDSFIFSTIGSDGVEDDIGEPDLRMVEKQSLRGRVLVQLIDEIPKTARRIL